jgi:hypothetical protein
MRQVFAAVVMAAAALVTGVAVARREWSASATIPTNDETDGGLVALSEPD